MTARAPGGPSRGAAAPTRMTWTRDGVGAILAVLALGLAFRFIIAQANPGIGLSFDLSSFRGWADNLASQGLYGFYERDFFHDYTPGYLYVLYLVGVVGHAMGGIGDLIKVPAILADAAIAWLVWSMANELGLSRRAALIGAAIAIANPVTWFDSVIWGQVDSFGVVFLLLGVRELWRDRPERSAVWAVIAALIKPQLGILIPIVAIVTIRRALWPEGGFGWPRPTGEIASVDADEGVGLLDRVRAWERRTDQPVRILTTGLAALATTIVLCAPFGLSILSIDGTGIHSGLIQQVFSTAGGYPYVTVNAYNPWALASLDGTGLAATGQWICDVTIPNPIANGPVCPVAFQFGPVPSVYVGAALLIAAFTFVCAIVALRPDRLTILVGLTVLAIAFFVLPTRVHERYLYPLFALGAIVAAASWRWLVAYVLLSIGTFLNMYAVITTIYSDTERGMVDWLGIGKAVTSTAGVSSIAVTTLVVAVWAFAQLRPGAVEVLEEEVQGRDDEPDWGVEDAVVNAGANRNAGVAMATRMAATRSSEPRVALPTWTERPSFAEVGLIEWLRTRLSERPIRADRSRDLHEEPGGRLDRLDLWFLVVLVVAILGVRMFRLSEPYQMHFDEVYHARTATEFLQDWRYGISHSIYEYTHPHLAKYVMAGGIVAWGDDRVSATSALGVPVKDAIVEPRRDDPQLLNGRAGDRVHVVTGSELRTYDLQGRQLIFSTPIAGASALTIDPVGDRLFIGTTDGQILTFDLLGLDGVSDVAASGLVEPPQAFASIDGSIRQLYATDDGQSLFAATDDGRLVTLDATSAEQVGSIELAGIAGFAPGGTGATLSTLPGSVEDPAAVASILADLLGGDAASYKARLTPTDGGTIVAGVGGVDQRANIDAAIADGRLAGLEIEDAPRVAIATSTGVTFVTGVTGDVVSRTPLDGGAHGLDLVTNIDDPKLYVTTGGTSDGAPGEVALIVTGGAEAKNGPFLKKTIPLPAPGTRVAYDDASQMVHVLGATPDGDGSTIYVIEPHADAVFADARLPFTPAAWAIDTEKPYPTDDRQQILAFDAAGDVASVEIGKHAFSWRLPGVIAGALMAGLLYLLTRILFRRREIAVLVGILAIADGMLFVQSRIGMNDAYVGLGIVAAYTLFAAIWTGMWRWRGAFWVAMPVIGVFLGLALASKWVALYAIGGLGLLILARSALGRFLLVCGLIAVTAVLGHLAIVVPNGSGFGNLPFVAIMIALTSVAVAVNVLHPIAWSDDERRFAIAAPAVGGVLLAIAAVALGKTGVHLALITLPPGGEDAPLYAITPIIVALALIASSMAVYFAFVIAGRSGFGPLAVPPDPSDPAALLPPPDPPPSASWLRPGALLGLPVAWMVVCLLIIPVAVYVISYIPWALVEGHRITDTWPPGHEGQTLIALTQGMYEYHNNLTAGHAASSPWWAWPFDLKPVWFYQEGFAGSTTAAIYDAGNLVIWWLGVPALLFISWQAYARRSLGLALLAIGFAFQWVSWSRIDRAAFQYHYYTSLPFVIIGLAYFAAELWHGTSRRIWLFARISAAIAVLGPALLWLFDQPLCAFVGVERAVPDSAACPPLIPNFVLTAQTLALAVVVLIAMVAFLYQLASLDLGRTGESPVRQLAPLGITAAGTLVALAIVRLVSPEPILTMASFPVEPIAAVGVALLGFLAAFVATARDARRFVVGLVTAVIAWFLLVYPNISALPLPSVVANAYQGVLPTYLYAFQFPSNREAVATAAPLIDIWTLVIGTGVAFLSIVLAYSAWVWRIAIAEREADEQAADDAASAAGLAAGPGAT